MLSLSQSVQRLEQELEKAQRDLQAALSQNQFYIDAAKKAETERDRAIESANASKTDLAAISEELQVERVTTGEWKRRALAKEAQD